MRPRRLVSLLVLALVLLLAGCGRPAPPSTLLPADVLRCDLDEDPTAAYRAASQALIDAARGDPDFAAGGLIVAYGPRRTFLSVRTGPEPAAGVRRDFGLTRLRSLGERLELVRADDPLAVAERLLADPRVRYVQPSVHLFPQARPTDPLYGQQWNLSSFGLERAWELERGAPDVEIAIVDSGLDVHHPEFAGRLLDGWDFYGDDADVSGEAHGTHVAGIAAATAFNEEGVAGVAHAHVRILPIKVLDDDGVVATDVAVASAIRWAAGLEAGGGVAARARPVNVINVSLGTPANGQRYPVLDDAIRDARRQGVVVVVSAGNHSSTDGVSAPANSPCALAVGSVDEDLSRTSFSNYDIDERVIDLAAPGGESLERAGVLSTVPLDDGGYGTLQGTSMAAPFVSGAVALLASAHPDWSDVEILDRLLRTAYLPDPRLEMELGFGVACVDAALGATTRCGR